jgi:hypothetical protein
MIEQMEATEDCNLLDEPECDAYSNKSAHPKELEQYDNMNIPVEDIAAERDCYVYRPESREVLLDLDGLVATATFRQRFEFLQRVCPDYFLEHTETPSKSGFPNKHVVIKVRDELTDVSRLLLQCLLGSDINREIMNFSRLYMTGDSDNVLMFPNAQKVPEPAPVQVPGCYVACPDCKGLAECTIPF